MTDSGGEDGEDNQNDGIQDFTMNDSRGSKYDEENQNHGIQGQKSCDVIQLSIIMSELDVPSVELKTSTIQNLMLLIKRHNTQDPTSLKYNSDFLASCSTLSDKTWKHLMVSLPTFDDQLLCATCFYTVLNLSGIPTQKLYMQKVLQIIQSELIRKENGSASDSETTKSIALMYGMFQSNFLTYTEDIAVIFEESVDLKTVTKNMIKLLILMAYEYSKFTYITFKTMSAFEKIRGFPAQDLIFDKETCDNLLVMINHNWENPITGVRDLNKKVLYTCLSVITSYDGMRYGHYYKRFLLHLRVDDEETFISDVEFFEWNKAKYLMAAEMIKSSFVTTRFNDGVGSLHKPGVVAAGADLYYVILQRIETVGDWRAQYLSDIITILGGPSQKAIENFTDYWCIPTFKKFPSALNMLIDELGEIDAENKLLSWLSLYKQANKLGIMNLSEWKRLEDKLGFIIVGLDHCNTKIRMLAFEILCTSQIKEMTDVVLYYYERILSYIKMNINSDCRVLRINMIKSLKSIFLYLHEIYRGKDKNKSEFKEDEVFTFCRDYQYIMESSLKIKGNYQRKVTCIQLIDTFFNYLSNVQRKRKETTEVETSLVKALECKGILIFMQEDFIQALMKMTNDAADDIRESTNKVLLKYYIDHLKKGDVINSLMDEAQRCLSSKLFYEISCGHSKFNLIIDVLLQNSDTEIPFQNVDRFLQLTFENLMSEYKESRGIVESIDNGKQLHSFITLLCAVFQKCQENNYQFKFSREQFVKLLEVLRGISNQFVWEQDDSTSSDFAKINEMVEYEIRKSRYGAKSISYETKLSGLQQIVLNCLWLNVKASCELSCIIIQCQENDDSRDICESALTTISRVLETCRHKGAIEAAGVALGKAIRHLTSVESSLSSLPMEWLQNKMRELVCQPSAMASVTRRGAGLSIMLHRAVANDARKDKPLFQYFMNTILEACNKAEIQSQAQEKPSNIPGSSSSGMDVEKMPVKKEDPINENTKVESIETDKKKEPTAENMKIKPTEEKKAQSIKNDMVKQAKEDKEKESKEETEKESKEETEKDVPKAVYIHFLTRIVTDSSLTCDVMFYSAQIAELAFGNLTSPHWQIRNAALQLYGAQLPKLIGQKKSASDDQPFATVGCDELRTHSPKLWNYMMQRLNNQQFVDIIDYHSTLVPILNVLANCAKRYNLHTDLIRKQDEDTKLLQSLERLLQSPIYTVRKLAAKSIYNIASYNWLQYMIFNVPYDLGENEMNGRLMLLGHFMQHGMLNYPNRDELLEVYQRAMYTKIGTYNYSYRDKRSRSYFNQQKYLEAFDVSPNIAAIWDELLNNCYAPGVEEWALMCFEIALTYSPWNCVPMYMISVIQLDKSSNDKQTKQDLQWFDGETYLFIALNKIEKSPMPEYIQAVHVRYVFELLLTRTKNASYATWKIIYEIVKQFNPQEFSDVSEITHAFNNHTNVCYKTRYALPFAARFVQVLGDITAVTRITDVIESWTDPDVADSDLRYVAALAINELAFNFKHLPEKLKVTVIKSAVLLLQDEEERVRNTSVEFYQILVKSDVSLQPYVCLLKLMEYTFLITILSKEMILYFCEQLTKLVDKLSTRKVVDDNNPFSNESSNIYLEIDFLKRRIFLLSVPYL